MPSHPLPHPFAAVDRPAVARALSQIADRPGDLADVYMERLETVELPPAEAPGPGLTVRREEGLAVRLVRGGDAWLAAVDHVGPDAFTAALRRAARVLPAASYAAPALALPDWGPAPEAPEVRAFPAAVQRAIRERRAAFPLALTVTRHRRWLQVVGGEKLVPEPQSESFYSLRAEMPFGSHGTLLTELGAGAAERLADRLVERFRGRDAEPPAPFCGPVVLGPDAAAVLLHEAVAHALEADLLAVGGDPEAAPGVELGNPLLHVLDDPTSAPEPVRRDSDDEGQATRRRWLLRAGTVGEPLCDARRAAGSEVLTAGAGRRAHRHQPPSPRSHHLELAPGDLTDDDLFADAEGGLYLPTAESGSLDPLTGRFRLRFPGGRRLRGGAPAEAVGPCGLDALVADLLGAVTGVGTTARPAGAGWCAKGGQKLPVWATCPPLRLDGVEVAP